jgi:serine/threonine protein kinase
VGVHEGGPYVVTELLEGETLRERLAGGALPPRKAIEYALQIAHGLAVAHEKGIVHRDLKPENLFVTKHGRVKILDFGLAKLTHVTATFRSPTPPAEDGGLKAATTSEETEVAGTQPGTVLGTVGYMSPEQVRGKSTDHRSDVFSFGAILYEMLSGRRAFQRDTAAESMTDILKEEPPDLPSSAQVPLALDRIVRHCLERNPEERFRSAYDLAFALENISGVSSPGTAPQIVERKRWLQAARLRWALALAAAALLIGVFAAGMWLGSSRARPTSWSGVLLVEAIACSPDARTIYYSASKSVFV